MIRLLMLLCAVLAPAAAAAGDIASRSLLGFNADGSRFAFEEYGTADGSGFPYATIYVVDTARDTWVPGTPVRVRLEDETRTIAQARAAAAARARPLLSGISPRGELVASNPISEISADPHRVAFVPRIVHPPVDPPLTLELAEYDLPSPSPYDETKGFRLVLKTGETARTLHEDRAIPPNRGLPFGYRIADVVTYHPPVGTNAPPVLVVLILVLAKGFETPDGRHLAVAARLGP
ncbi:DUF2259 domain-containing protein [Phreatobacter stygius]|uniref:DUF2259 domain-containing protein n=1 Tax=Phreatobacter stygius TaxID=1940610 RepID=A0A4D7ATH5_9HYPH|nr:DUF2259 domain-containing protein [Phreatobacter stygius]QCI62875.1 DUF2259 domain-containing protein [Phreatobacter stygius]